MADATWIANPHDKDESQNMCGSAKRHSGRIIIRWLVVNCTLLFIAGIMLISGWGERIAVNDRSGISAIIMWVFLAGLAFGTRAAAIISSQINRAQLAREDILYWPDLQDVSVSALKIRLSEKIGKVRYIASMLVVMGLIGTVYGFIEAFTKIDMNSVSDASAAAGMVGAMTAGMGVAFYTTLTGSVLFLWLTTVHRLVLQAGVSQLLALVIEIQAMDSTGRTENLAD